MKFGFISKRRSVWPAAWLCEAFSVSRSSFRAWLKRGPCARSREDEVVMPAVRASFVVSPHRWRPSDLRYVPEAGFSCGLHKIERLMRSQALRAATQARPAERRRRTLGLGDRAECARSPVHGGPAQPQMDCRLHPCLKSRGLAHVAAVIDLFSRRVVGWSMKPEMSAQRRHRRVVNGDLTARAPGCAVASLRQSIDQGRLLGLTLAAMDRLPGWRRKAIRRGLTPYGLVTVLSRIGPGEAVHARSELEAGNGCHRRSRASRRRRRGCVQRSACRGGRGRTGSRS